MIGNIKRRIGMYYSAIKRIIFLQVIVLFLFSISACRTTGGAVAFERGERSGYVKGHVKTAPYVVKGKRYVPMSVKEASKYRQKGIASWYGHETLRQKGVHMTANGEAFDPKGLYGAHKYLPLPTYVKVTNLKNNRTIIVRVNDRGPFVKGRIIDLTAAAAKKLGFYKKGTTTVLVETIRIES